jgi:hypothetical protein
LTAIAVYACSVPVFRYALERWPPDNYRAIVVHEGELTEEQQKIVDDLTAKTSNGDGFLNLQVYTADSSIKTNTPVSEFAQENKKDEPYIHLLYPWYSRNNTPIWSAPLKQESSDILVQSEFLDKVSDDILQGRTAVWVLLESGNKEKDEAAYKILKEGLAVVEEELELPEGVATPDGDVTGEDQPEYIDPINQLQAAVPLKISFSIAHLKNSNEKEKILLASLLNLEPDLKELKGEPMIFPVFGQGRVMPPIAGEAISEENIYDYAHYLCAPCSCQVKAMNPGMDLLIAKDWYSVLSGSEVVEDKGLPPLSGVADLIAATPEHEPIIEESEITEDPGGEEEEKPAEMSPLVVNLGLLLVVLVICAVAGSMMMGKKE